MQKEDYWKEIGEEKARSYWNATRYILARINHYFDEDLAYEIDMKYGIAFDEALRLVQVLRELKNLFDKKSDSWFQRSAVRALFVIKKTENWWLLPGFKNLGDKYAIYAVVYDAREKKYYCDCFWHYLGKIRQIKICTHIGAVIVYRRLQRRITEYI